MTSHTVDLQGASIGFSLSNYRDLSILKDEACWMLGISRERLRFAIKCVKEINKSVGSPAFTCDRTTDTWIAYDHLTQVAIWLALRGNNIAREFAYLANHYNLIDAFNLATADKTNPIAATTREQWSIHFDWVRTIGFGLDRALDTLCVSEEIILPFISIDPLSWRISDRLYEFGFGAAPRVLRAIKYELMPKVIDKNLVSFPDDNPDDVDVQFELLPLLDDAIRSVVRLS